MSVFTGGLRRATRPPAEHRPALPRAQIQSRGGANYVASWGKFWLAVLGVYSWDGMNPMPPEMWLLPYSAWSGVGLAHPGRFWCHCRMVYLPMSYLYGARATGRDTPLTAALREELYVEDYASINWNRARNQVPPHPPKGTSSCGAGGMRAVMPLLPWHTAIESSMPTGHIGSAHLLSGGGPHCVCIASCWERGHGGGRLRHAMGDCTERG